MISVTDYYEILRARRIVVDNGLDRIFRGDMIAVRVFNPDSISVDRINSSPDHIGIVIVLMHSIVIMRSGIGGYCRMVAAVD